VLRGHSHALAHAAFLPDGRRVVTCSYDTTCRVWRVRWDDLISFLGDQTFTPLLAP